MKIVNRTIVIPKLKQPSLIGLAPMETISEKFLWEVCKAGMETTFACNDIGHRRLVQPVNELAFRSPAATIRGRFKGQT